MNRTYQLTDDDILNIIQQVNDGCKWQEVLASIQTKEAPLATAFDVSALDKIISEWDFADRHGGNHGQNLVFLRERIVGYLATLQPPSGQVGEVIELAIRILNQESSMNGCIKGTIWADDHTTLVELLENTREALRQPVETVGEMTLIKDIRMALDEEGRYPDQQWARDLVARIDALRTQPQAPEATPIGWGWKNEMGITEVRTDRMSKEMIANLNAFPVYAQPQAPVCPACGGTWEDDKNGTCDNEFHCYHNKPQAPVVEDLLLMIDSEISKGRQDDVYTDEIVDRIRPKLEALLQSKGGR